MNSLNYGILKLGLIAGLSVGTTGTFAYGQAGTQRGATLGGLTGAVAGALIGDNNGEAGAGAAIGGVVGAVAGGILGNAKDKDSHYRAQQHFYQAQQYQTQAQQYQTAVNQSAVSINDVVSMSRSGLSDTVITNQIRQRGVVTELGVHDIIALHQQGVSEHVISAMQQSPTGIQQIARTPQPVVVQPLVRPAPVIVEEHIVVPTYRARAPHRHYHRGHSFHYRF